MRRVNVLLFPAGAENALELRDALRFSTRFKTLGGTSVRDNTAFLYKPEDIVRLPMLADDAFWESLNAAIQQREIRFIFPTHDSVVLELARRKDKLAATALVPNFETARACRDKRVCYELFKDCAFTPNIWNAPPNRYPCFAKPASGQGGQGCGLVRTPKEAEAILQRPDMLLCEYLPGEEYTIDCFTDQNGALLFAGQRSRDLVKMGIAFRSGSMALDPQISAIADALNARLHFRGLWFFQVKRDAAGRFKLLEVSARVATGMGLFRQQGINLPLLTLYDAMGMPVTPLKQNFRVEFSRSLKNSYRLGIEYDTVYVDYDDTLTNGDKVNATTMQFLWQCLNKGKRIILLSRHEGDLAADMKKRRINADMFDDIIVLPSDQNKSVFISSNAILLDNLFSERLEVHLATGIPVFDVDALDSLITDC